MKTSYQNKMKLIWGLTLFLGLLVQPSQAAYRVLGVYELMDVKNGQFGKSTGFIRAQNQAADDLGKDYAIFLKGGICPGKLQAFEPCDRYSAHNSVILFGKTKQGNASIRAFAFDRQGDTGAGFDDFWKVFVQTIAPSDVGKNRLVVTARSMLRGEFEKMTFRAYYETATVTAELQKDVKGVLDRVYGRLEKLATKLVQNEAPESVSEFAQMMDTMIRKVGDGRYTFSRSALQLPVFEGQQGVKWENGIRDRYLLFGEGKTSGDLIEIRENGSDYVSKWAARFLGVERWERLPKTLPSGSRVYSYYNTGAQVEGFKAGSSFSKAAADFVRYEIVRAFTKDGQVRYKEYTWILNNGSTYTYLPDFNDVLE